jgi:signal transduction histidine kinase
MKPFFTRKITLNIFSITIGLLILGTFIVSQNIQGLIVANTQVMNTYEVIEKMNGVLGDITSAHDQAENYVNNGSQAAFQNYRHSLDLAKSQLIALPELFKENSLQKIHFAALQPNYTSYLLTLDTLIKKYQSTHQKVDVVNESRDAKLLLTKIKNATTRMSDEGYAQLQQRNAKIVNDSKQVSYTIVTVSSLSNVLLFLCFILLSYQEKNHLDEQFIINQELEATNQRLQAAGRLKSEFMSNMSHELRTPLNGVIGLTELMHQEQVGPVSTEQKALLSQVICSAKELLDLINNLLDLSSADIGTLEFHPENVDLKKTVQDMARMFESLLSRKKIVYQAYVADDIPHVFMDLVRFKQVLYNYLSNAIKFTPEGGEITVRLTKESINQFRLSVSDTGIGIKQDDLTKLFVNLQQLDASSSKHYAGIGSGLAITKKIVEAQGGSVGVTSEVNNGSTFYALLPIVEQPLDLQD